MQYKIISGRYEAGSAKQQSMYSGLLGAEHIQYKYDLYFHWYNVVHELGHCLLDKAESRMDPVEEEYWVNRFAVAYWKQCDMQGRLEQLQELLENSLNAIPNPVPSEQSYMNYFKEAWNTIWTMKEDRAAMLYGYFQFSCVLEAMKCRDDLYELLHEAGIITENTKEGAMTGDENIGLIKKSLVANPEMVDRMFYLEPYCGGVSAEEAARVLRQCLTNLEKLGIVFERVELELTDNPGVHCSRRVEI